jgi:hypothetical protein
MNISAMKQALKALERADKISGYANNQMAIYALRQAIEQAEKQEPVGYFSVNDYGNWEQNESNYGTPLYTAPVHASDISAERVDETVKDRYEWNEIQCPCGHKMYAKYTKREWVGLTDGDIAKTMQGSVEGSNMLPYQFARAIEAKLKEKNT